MSILHKSEYIIENIKQYPVLYNPEHEDYKNPKKKLMAWQQLAEPLEESVESVKKRWKNIRDAYNKYIRSTEMDPLSHTALKYGKLWSRYKYAASMEPFRPYVGKHGDKEVSISGESSILPEKIIDEDDWNSTNDDAAGELFHIDDLKEENEEEGIDSDYHEVEYSRKRKRIKLDSNTNENIDALNHLFLYYASTVNGFLPKRQILTKLKIAKIMMEEELADQDERNKAKL